MVSYLALILSLLVLVANSFCDIIFTSQPRIRTQDGNLIFISAENRNISLKTVGPQSFINFNGENLINLVNAAKNATIGLQNLHLNELEDRQTAISNSFRGILHRVDVLEANLQNETANSKADSNARSLAQLRRQMLQLKRRVLYIGNLLSTNECNSNPCQNGGSCEDSYGKFICRCPPNWQGNTCAEDVNECARFVGTDLGCQNGATCINRPGSYDCMCPPSKYGLHCLQTSNDCSSGAPTELCGNGICINQNINGRGFTCICNQGWQKDPSSSACSLDVNECESPNFRPCSTNPRVQCINTPGSFVCGSCPNGYTGNGYVCDDIDECRDNNGGCSTAPLVQCINTHGSRVCGPCPPGYQGNGITCEFRGVCQINNGGCHPLARCYDNPIISSSYVQCTCPPGYRGNGVGINGCVQQSGTDTSITSATCSPNPCIHGTCMATPGTNAFTCLCYSGFTGTLCERVETLCNPNPCQNGGSCVIQNGTFTCRCINSFKGQRCESQETDCGGVLRADSGNLTFPTPGVINYNKQMSCLWLISVNITKSINLTITSLNIPGPSNCSNHFLEVHDGNRLHSPLLGSYCGSRVPSSINSTHSVMALWFHTADWNQHTGFSLMWSSKNPVCGGQQNSPENHGNIESPGAPGKYPKNRDCVWIITVPTWQRIQMHIFSLMLETHENCSFDFIRIYNGGSDNRPLLEEFCTTSQPAPFMSSGHQAYIHFHSDDRSSDYGFRMTYSAVPSSSGCGGIWTSESGTLTSPNFLETYDDNLHCEYLIKLPPRERARVTFEVFELESSLSSCTFDYLEIHDGENETSPTIGKFCGTDHPASFVSSSNKIFMIFNTDSSVGHKGFKITYSTVCGGMYATLTGVVKSANYPEPYPGEKECIYEIAVPLGMVVSLQFQDFELEDSPGNRPGHCIYDIVEIRDGNHANSRLIGTYCNHMPPHIVSTYNHLWIKFTTDESMHHRGFFANYTAIDTGCGGILRNSSGVISTNSNNREICNWIIFAPEGSAVQLVWTSFHVRNAIQHSRRRTYFGSGSQYMLDTSCSLESVTVFDNSSTSEEGSLIGRYCGFTLPPTLTSIGNILHIIKNARNRFFYFSANYTLKSASEVCGSTYYATNGILRSPLYPKKYPNNLNCVWIISVPVGQQIMMNVSRFQLEPSSTCSFDYLEIRNGATNTSPLIGKFCGETIPLRIPSFANSLYIKFHSDVSIQGSGFYITWDGTARGCGGTLNGPTGSITSPNYPSPYDNNVECFWKIVVNRGSVIKLIVVDLDMQVTDSCIFSYVEVRDGAMSSSPLLGRYCRTSQLMFVTSTKNAMWIKFRGHRMVSERGFHLRYESVCNNKLIDFRGVIESPNFPNVYPHNVNCTWTISAPPGNKINVSFSNFELENDFSANCSMDFLQIKEGKDGASPMNTLGHFCGNEVPQGVISSQLNTVYIQFVTDISAAFRGFRLEWIVHGCGGIFDAPYGVLQTPNYPNAYPLNTECRWIIQVDWDQSIELTLNNLNMERAPPCMFKVWGGLDETSPELANFCKPSTSPQVVTSSGRTMRIVFRSNASHTGRAIQATYKAVQSRCGGKFSGVSGSIHSKNYPSNYDAGDDCEWLIEVEKNNAIALTFIIFDLGAGRNCSNAYLKVYDGPNSNSPLLLDHCGNVNPNPNVINSTGNWIYIRMKAGTVHTSTGFMANYTMKCGARIITNDTGILKAVDNSYIYPTMANANNCTWIIIADQPDGHVTLTFTHFQISESETECNDRFIEIRDGDGILAPLRNKYCGNRIPAHITSEGQALTVTMVSTSIPLRNDDFTATYSVLSDACGGHLTSEEGTIASPKYPRPYPQNIECIWTINTSPGNKVSLTFGAFNLEESENCNEDYLEIRSGLTGTSPLIGVYCGNTIPSNLTTYTKIWMKFRSSAQVASAGGFLAFYAMVHGGELSGASGILANPLYPKPLARIGEYSWRISVALGTVIRITFRELTLEVNNCATAITIFDGYDETAAKLAYLCKETTIPDPITSTTNVVYIYFTNVPFNHYGGIFYLEWLQIGRTAVQPTINTTSSPVPGCGGFYNNFTLMNLTSPNYPHGYAPNLYCEWIFEVASTYHVVFNFRNLDLSLGYGRRCFADYVSVYSGTQDQNGWTLMGDFCLPNATLLPALHATNLLKVVFQSNYLHNRTGFAATVRQECGGSLQNSNGVIEVTNMFHRVVVGLWSPQICEYNITVRRGRKIKVQFDVMDISDTNSCSTEYVILKNGAGRDSPLLGDGKYCGQSIPTIPQTSSNRLYIMYTGNRQNRTIFRLRYEEVSESCGDRFVFPDENSFRVITSPNHPQIPPLYIECEWIFIAPQGHRLRVDFPEELDITSSRRCEKEYLEIKDGGSSLAPQIGKFCSKTPDSQWSTDSAIYIHYFTDVPNPKNGFMANISVAKCGGTIRSMEAVINAPELSEELNVSCVWHVNSLSHHLLRIKIESMNIPASVNCTGENYLILTNNALSNNETLIGKYCGTSYPSEWIDIGSDKTIITFRSSRGSGPTSGRTFKIRMSTTVKACYSQFSTPEGTITSPDYPNTQQIRRLCTFLITVPRGRSIKLEFLDFDLQGDSSSCNQWLGVYNGYAGPSAAIAFYCGSSSPDVVISPSNQMEIRTYVFVPSSHRGWRARYTSDAPSVCQGSLELESGSLQFPVTNITNLFCKWERTEAQDTTTNSTFAITIFNATISEDAHQVPCLQAAPNLLIYSGTNLLGQFCDNYTTPIVVCNPFGNTVIRARKGEPESMIEFNIGYKLHRCGGILYGPSEITTPNYPQEYNASSDCAWSLQYPEGQTILLTFITMDLEPECDHDYVAIYNGRHALAPLIGTYCGISLPPSIRSQRNNLFVVFHSDALHQGQGFQITTQAASTAFSCGGILQDNTGNFTSPNFPNNYPNNVECEWEIRVGMGYHIGLTFKDRFQIQESNSCNKDFVEIFNYNGSTWVSLGKVCGRDLPPFFNSTGNRMKILFRSNEDVTGDGFNAVWNVNCGGIFTARSGVIVSPGYPGEYTKNMICNYTIVAHTYLISYKFVDFSLEQGFPDCRYDNVTIYVPSYNTPRNPRRFVEPRFPEFPINQNQFALSTYCGQDTPPDGVASSILTVVFQTDHWMESRGFKMVYDTCGGEITSPTLIQVNNGGDIDGFPRRSNCTWVITAPTNQIVVLRFQKLELLTSYNCINSYIAVYEGSFINSKNLTARICGNLTDSNVRVLKTTSSSQMVLTYITEYHGSHKLEATVSFSYGPTAGCGGVINATVPGQYPIHSIPTGRNLAYAPMLECHWLIHSEPGSNIEFRVESMNISDCTNSRSNTSCLCDYIEIYDGPTQFAERIGRYCGSNLPEPIVSSGSTLFIIFSSDDAIETSGFEGFVTSVTSPCGISVLNVTDVAQDLVSPNYPDNYPMNIRCKWQLKTNAPMKIDIHIVGLDTEYSQDCTNDRLAMIDSQASVDSNEGFGEDFIYKGRNDRGGPMNVNLLKYVPSRTNVHKSVFCGRGKDMDYYSISSSVDVTFKSNNELSGKGFKLVYRTVGCSRNFTRSQGRIVISSPGRTGPRDVCNIYIETEINRTISLYFSEAFAYMENCDEGLKIYDGMDTTSSLLLLHCGRTAANPVFSTSNALYLRLPMSHQESYYRGQYDMTYTTTDQGRGCGGNIYNVAGSLASPLYPNNVRNFTTCVWYITTPELTKIHILFLMFNIGPDSTCSTDYLLLYDIDVATGNEIMRTRLCGEIEPAPFIAGGNTVKIKYVTSVHNAGTGWTLNFGILKQDIQGG